MINNFLKSRWLLYALLFLLSGLYWCVDSVWSYISYEQNLNALLFMVPSSFLDTFFLDVAPYQIAARIGVSFLLLFSGTQLIELAFRKQKMASALDESEERYQYLLEHANVGACIIQNTMIKIPNLKLLEISGYPEEELKALPFIELVHPDDKEMVLGWRDMALAGENPLTEIPFQIITKGQSVRWLQLSTTTVVWRENPAQFCVLHDITNRKLREEKQQQTRKMDVVGLLAGGVAHDLNNILSGIVSYPELLLHLLPDDSPLCSHVETMHEAGLRASAIVTDLLTVARGVASPRHIVDLNVLVEKFIETSECQVLKKRYPGIRVSSQLCPEVVPVFCSEIHIQKSIMNLSYNAFEAIEEETGHVTLSTNWKELSEEEALPLNLKAGSYAILSVLDTGPGILEEHKEHIFEPFYTRKIMGRSGTGLGLTVVWNTMVDHDGGIDILTSEEGTVFNLYLPLAPITTTTRKSLVEPEPLPIRKGSKERILIVDDDSQQREITYQSVKFLNYTPISVASGEEAVEFLKHEQVDLVLLDMLMDPGISGCETYEQILAIKHEQKALIISGYAEHEEIAKAIQLGVGGLIKKPYALRDLAGAIYAELGKSDAK